jgi:hypothetical protein
MRGRLALALTLLPFVAALSCGPTSPEEFEGYGSIRGTFLLGDRTLRQGAFVELRGPAEAPPDERCGPADCGVNAGGMENAAVEWPPGTWLVVAPPAKGWQPPEPFEIVVEEDRTTKFEAEYTKTKTN